MTDQMWGLIALAGGMLLLLAAVSFFSQRYSLDQIKSKTVGDGQYGSARWATPGEIRKTYVQVPFRVSAWRRGIKRPTVQGLVVGSVGPPSAGKKQSFLKRGRIYALVDCDDVHLLMIGASGVGKTAFFLYPNLEYACACGMSFLALDTKGDLARNYGSIAQKYYGYRVSVIDLRNPTRSDGNNLLTLINRYIRKQVYGSVESGTRQSCLQSESRKVRKDHIQDHHHVRYGRSILRTKRILL